MESIKCKKIMDLIVKTIEMLLIMIEGILGFFLSIAESIVDSTGGNKKHDASFSSGFDILSSFNRGICLTGSKSLTLKKSFENVMIIGGTGSGKSSVCLISTLYKTDGSFIVNDPSGELYAKTAGALKLRGYDIKVLNFAKPEISSSYNPLTRANSTSEIMKFSKLTVESSLGGSKEQFWNLQSCSLLAMLISVLKKLDKQYQNPANLLHLVNLMGANPEGVDALFSKYADEKVWAEYKNFIAADDKITSGVLASVKSSLLIYADDAVAAVTSRDNINMEDFRLRKTALFINTSVAESSYYAKISSIFFEQLISYILGRFPAEGEQPIFLLLDEASSLILETLPLFTANCRKNSAGCLISLQDYVQLEHSFGKNNAQAIKSNCAQMYFAGTSIESAKYLEDLMGKFEFRDKDKHKVIMPLMSADKIRIMKSNKALIVVSNKPIIKTSLRPYYQNRKFKSYSLIPPPVIKSIVPETLPLLTLPKPNAEDKAEQ
jgi:type IV secretion system protein VirD4